MNSKKYMYTWEDMDESNEILDSKTLSESIINDAELSQIEELIIGCWGESWENGAQPIIDMMVENKEKFSHIKSIFIGDMEYDECEVSWIEQGDYSKLWDALGNLEEIKIKGSTNLELGEIHHDKLKKLTIECGGIPKNVLNSIANAKLPALEHLEIYIGIDNYGFDGDIDDIKAVLNGDFPNLQYLGIVDSDIEDDIVEAVLKSKYVGKVSTLDFSKGSLTDKGGEMLLEAIPKNPNVKCLNLEYHYMSEKMCRNLHGLSIDVNTNDAQTADEYDGEVWYYPLLTE